ncbi:MAG: dihydropteroate synthase [Fluviicola sp.]|nr:MAG: dihydropteroate synthase [Fluviicola sp.]
MDVKDNKIERKTTIKCGDKLIQLNELKIMGILNVTPDSFHSDSRQSTVGALLDSAQKMISAGADFIDIGGYSTRPGADFVSEKDEMERVIPAITELHRKFPSLLISIDTFRSKVAELAIENGASLINDVSGGRFDSAILDVAAKWQVPYILMHSRGDSKTMQGLTNYDNVVTDVSRELSEKIAILKRKGVKDIIIDPGFGFAKNQEQNYKILNHLDFFQSFGLPIIVGVSRKGMIYNKLYTNQAEALNGTTIVNTVAALKGANILRVHDVIEAKEIATLLSDSVLNT